MRLSELFYRSWDLLHFVSGEGSWSLHPHEQVVIDAAVNSLATDEQDLARKQLDQDFFVDRTSNGRINVLRFYDGDKRRRIEDPAFDDRLLCVRIAVVGARQTAHVTFYKGIIFSVEFKKPGKFYAGKRVKVVDVGLGSPHQTYTRGIDRLEHGRDPGNADA